MEIFECEQNTPEWHAARLGIPTSSMFATVMAKGKGGGESETRKTYMYKLAGEIITGEPMDNYSNAHMERGHVMEAEAREMYAFIRDGEPIQRVGFIRRDRKGCSPDALVGDRGMCEIKTKLAHLMIEVILRDSPPPEFRAQCQGALWIAERDWLDLTVYWPRMPLFVKRVYRDDQYINDLSTAVDTFNAELDEVVAKVRKYSEAA